MNKNRSKKQEEPLAVKRNYKDTLFRMVFREPRALLSLYNAVNGTDYQNPEELQIVTLKNAIYMNMKNDLAFLIDCRMSLYSSRLVKLPTPCFVVFYNGTSEQPERKEMKLSDSFQTPVEEPALELKVLQLNIGVGHNRELMENCPLLAQYSQYVGRVQKYAREMQPDEAVKRAVGECIQEGILADFLQRNRAEAIAVSIFEYDEEKELALFRKAEREEGREEGRHEELQRGIQALISTCQEFGASFEATAAKLKEKYSMDENEVKEKMKLYWK